MDFLSSSGPLLNTLSHIFIFTQQTFTCSKSTLETLEGVKYVQNYRRHRRHSSVFIANFEYISHLFLVFQLLTLNKKMIAGEWHYPLTLIHVKRVGLVNSKLWLIAQICKIMVAKFTNSQFFFAFLWLYLKEYCTICKSKLQTTTLHVLSNTYFIYSFSSRFYFISYIISLLNVIRCD